jgi:hypothetical protein
MAKQEQIDKILAACADIRSAPVDHLVANPAKWGVFTFDAARPDLELIISLATHLSTLPIKLVPDNIGQTFADSAVKASESLKKLKAFDPMQGNPNEQIQQLTTQVQAAAQNLLVNTQSWIAFLAYQRGDVQRNIDALTKAVETAEKILEQARTKTTETKGEIDSIVVAAREASASAGVGVFTSDFAAQADKLEIAADGWLKLTGVFGATTLLFALASAFAPLGAQATSAQILQYMSSKFVILVTLLTATIWCGRLYKATKHQAVTNSHRANSLKTFQAFIKAASDSPTRDAVLLETTRSIFALAPTGYLESSEPAADTGTKVMEIFKGSKSAG